MFLADLPAPPPLSPGSLRIMPLGGLGEIGRNMTVFEYESRLLIVDCGVLFPEESHPGIDLILPDFEPILDRINDVDAIVLTHGHEDHIGAVPYLLRHRSDIPIIGSALTLAFIEAKLKEHRIKAFTMCVADRAVEKVGPFELEFLAVNHSIPDAVAIGITTPAGRVLHTGDFKMDQLPLDGRITDLASFARLGELGVDILMVDSTNAEVPGFVSSEKEIVPVLERVFSRAKGRVIIASFASHVHRIQQVIDIAVAHNRKIAFVGRSMVRNMNVARDLGYLKIPGNTLISLDELSKLPDDRAVLICTGSQGEPMAVLSRIANRSHDISVGDDDTIVLASSLIPGNENAIYRVINGLTALGADVVHKGNALVHVSGHAAAGELRYVFNMVKPKYVMPIHGEWRHLKANTLLAQSVGIPADHVLVAANGACVDLDQDQALLSGAYPLREVYVDGTSVGSVDESLLKDRLILGEEGFISVYAAVDIANRSVVVGPEIIDRGVGETSDTAKVAAEVAKALVQAMEDGIEDPHELSQKARKIVGKWVGTAHRRRPMIVPVVIGIKGGNSLP